MTVSKKERDLANGQASWEGKTRPYGRDAGSFRGFINVDLSDAAKEAFPAWLEEMGFDNALEAYCRGGVVLSVKVDPKSGGFLASATDKGEGSKNAGLATTARGRDPYTALARLLFVLGSLGDDWEAVQPIAQGDRW